ncbi:hypothetical protein M0R45_037608 [Rubus argutus]|uniref:Uncharacterized protein n=1 Tax=Rubus argutus TaxID=59490 RepID=A0AAW1W0S7_RUBAR
MLMKFHNDFVREKYDVHTVMPGRLLSVHSLFPGVRLGHFDEVSSILKSKWILQSHTSVVGWHRSLLDRRNMATALHITGCFHLIGNSHKGLVTAVSAELLTAERNFPAPLFPRRLGLEKLYHTPGGSYRASFS